MLERDCVTLNAMIIGFSRDGMNEDAIKLFMQMQHFGLKPSDFTFAVALCAGIGLDDIVFGQQIHSFGEDQLCLECVYGECFARFLLKV